MMKEAKNVPKLRFPEFTGEWEQEKLRELAEFNPKSTIPDSFEYVDLESVVGTEMLSHRTESKDSAPSRAQRLAQKGDLFYQTVRPYQRNNYLFEKPDDNYVFSTGYAQMRPYGDGRFLLGLVQTDRFVNLVLDRCTGTSYPAINSNDLAELSVYAPLEMDEQGQIGLFLKNLDTLITLQQRKLDQIKEYKKGMLQKMFPKEGESVPEVRFPEFTGDWEHRKLSEVYAFLQNNTLSRDELNNEGGIAKNVHYGDVLIKFGEYLDVSEVTLPFIESQQVVDKYKASLLQDGDIIMADTAEDQAVGKCTEINGLQRVPTISGLHTIPLRPKLGFASGFLGFYMNSNAYHDQLKPLMQGTKVTSVSKSAIQETMISYPADLTEQMSIAQVFINLNKAITLHQRKLDAMKEYKKGLLQQMFV